MHISELLSKILEPVAEGMNNYEINSTSDMLDKINGLNKKLKRAEHIELPEVKKEDPDLSDRLSSDHMGTSKSNSSSRGDLVRSLVAQCNRAREDNFPAVSFADHLVNESESLELQDETEETFIIGSDVCSLYPSLDAALSCNRQICYTDQ